MDDKVLEVIAEFLANHQIDHLQIRRALTEAPRPILQPELVPEGGRRELRQQLQARTLDRLRQLGL